MELNINTNSAKIFVGNVPFNCSNEEFFDAFQYLDGFINAELISRNQTGNTRGFGFVTFKDNYIANNFLESKEKIIIKDRVLRFTKYHNNSDDFIITNLKKNNIFVSNIPTYFTNEKLKEVFSKYGTILLGYINTDINTGKKINTGIIEFENEDSYIKVLSQKNILIENGKYLHVHKYRENIKSKANYNIREIYKIAFNAGKKYATLEKN